jgi:intraflagellar transport protein 27
MDIISMESNHKSIVMLRCKVVIVGDPCVGKTALTQVFQSGGSTYPKNYLMTVGTEFSVKQIPIPDSNVIVELYIFDCAGQSIFNQLEMNSKYYENASATMVVYDVSSTESFQSCGKWLRQAMQTARSGRTSGPRMVGCIVANKCEYRDGTVDSRAVVTEDEGRALATEMGLSYFETSASQNIDVDAPFKFIATEFHKRYEETVRRAEDMASSTV